MIVAGILAKVFKDMTLTYDEYSSTLKSHKTVTKPVQFHWGDSKELSKWIRGRNGKEKYPLIWYIIENVDNSNAETLNVKCCLVLFTSTKSEYYNNTRALINYTNILEPLTQVIYRLLDSNNYIAMLYSSPDKIFTTFDIPNYGVDYDDLDFKSKRPKGTLGISIDIVDARRIDCQMQIDKSIINCLI